MKIIKYLVLNNLITDAHWRLSHDTKFEIVADIGDYFLVWARGSCIAYDKIKYPNYKVEIEKIKYEYEGW